MERKIIFSVSRLSSGYAGNFWDLPNWISNAMHCCLMCWRDLLMDNIMSPYQLAEAIEHLPNKWAQLEVRFLKALYDDKVPEDLLQEYSTLYWKRVFGETNINEVVRGESDTERLTKRGILVNNASNLQSAGAYITHMNRTDKTEQKIIKAIDQLKLEGKNITKAAVGRMVGVKREHISRRYSYLFE